MPFLSSTIGVSCLVAIAATCRAMSSRGVDVSRQIRSRGARPGIVCVTSYSLGEYETAAADAGAQACVAKTDLQGLAAAITAAADGLPYRPSAKGLEDGSANHGNRIRLVPRLTPTPIIPCSCPRSRSP